MSTKRNGILPKLPERLHHTGFPVRDLAATREFYEDVLGLPLVATWCEQIEEFGDRIDAAHLLFETADGGLLGFTGFAEPAMWEKYGLGENPTPFLHISLKVTPECQEHIRSRLESTSRSFDFLDHGYCRSVYLRDPDGIWIEFTANSVGYDEIMALQRHDAHHTLERWLTGYLADNNQWREKGNITESDSMLVQPNLCVEDKETNDGIRDN